MQCSQQKSIQISIQMNKSVVVTAKDGVVVHPSPNNKEYGYIRLEQTRLVTEGGFGRSKRLSAIMPGKLTDLNSFGWKEKEVVEGKIIVKESLTPFNTKDPDSDIKMAGTSGLACTLGGQPIYRKHEFTFDVNAQDELIEHDNKDAIKNAYKAAEDAEGVTGNEGQEAFTV